MIKNLHLKSWLLLLCMIVGAGTAWGDSFTYNFASGGVFNSGDNPTCTWTTDYFTILQEQGTSTTKVANYTTAPRWYQNHTVTFTPAANIEITQIVINCSSTNNGQTITASSGSVSASGNNSTWIGTTTDSSPLTLTMGKQCRPTSINVTYTVTGTLPPSIIADDVIRIAYNDLSGTISYAINNAVTGTSLTASSTTEWISNVSVGTDDVTFTATANEGDGRIGIIKLTYGNVSKDVTVRQGPVETASLPFNWYGGTSEDLLFKAGVTEHDLGTDYGSSNAPYQVKFDTDGDYIQVKTDRQPGKVTIGVKMIGGENTSTITVQGSADGEDFTTVQSLTISGAQNEEKTLETANDFAATDRYVRLLFTKGSNVGVGSISIALPSNDPVISAENVSIEYNTTSGSIEYEIVHPVDGGEISAESDAEWLEFGEGTAFTASENAELAARIANVTLTYTYNTSSTVTKIITLTQTGNPNAAGSENNPYTVAQALANTPESGNSAEVYISGIVSAFYGEGDDIMDDTSNRYYISDDGTTTSDQLLVYKGKGLENVAFSHTDDLLIGDEVVIKGKLTTYNDTKEIASGNYIVSLNRPVGTDPVINAENVNLAYDATSGEIEYTIENPMDGTSLTASTDATWLTLGEVDTNSVPFTCSANEGDADRTATITLTYGTVTKDVTVTQGRYIAPAIEGTINFGSAEGSTKINSTSVTGNDSMGNTWTITTTFDGETSFTQHEDCSQVGSSSKPASTITFTTTLPAVFTITSFEAKFGGYNNTAGDITLKVGDTEVGTGSLNGANDVTVSNTSTANGTVLTVTVTNIAKGVKCYYISYKVACAEITVKAGFPGTTFSTDKALDFTNVSGVKAYIITDANGTTQEVTRVPAKTGLYLEVDETSADAQTFDVPVIASADAVNGNLLIATDGNEYKSDDEFTYYAYGKQNGKFAFFKVPTSGYTPSANKAVLKVTTPTGGAKDFIEVNGGGATSINAVETLQNENAAIYNLAGQRVVKAQKGIYIVNGKKVVIK